MLRKTLNKLFKMQSQQVRIYLCNYNSSIWQETGLSARRNQSAASVVTRPTEHSFEDVSCDHERVKEIY
jgi:hypothetical protein